MERKVCFFVIPKRIRIWVLLHNCFIDKRFVYASVCCTYKICAGMHCLMNSGKAVVHLYYVSWILRHQWNSMKASLLAKLSLKSKAFDVAGLTHIRFFSCMHRREISGFRFWRFKKYVRHWSCISLHAVVFVEYQFLTLYLFWRLERLWMHSRVLHFLLYFGPLSPAMRAGLWVS